MSIIFSLQEEISMEDSQTEPTNGIIPQSEGGTDSVNLDNQVQLTNMETEVLEWTESGESNRVHESNVQFQVISPDGSVQIVEYVDNGAAISSSLENCVETV